MGIKETRKLADKILKSVNKKTGSAVKSRRKTQLDTDKALKKKR